MAVERHHYLLGPDRVLWQLPGGGVDPGEDAEAAARRKLAEETGYAGGRWTCHGAVWPMPG